MKEGKDARTKTPLSRPSGTSPSRQTGVLTSLDTPTRLHAVLKDRGILGAARVLRNLGRLDRPTFLGEMQNENLPQPTLDFLQRTPWCELRDALDQLLDQGSGSPRPV